ncbi:hypothetical protein NPIL_108231 [Nephila pilipes]|uniref:Uncharacterized protein n=1 Tax=Nephila pilipes TaxID=299642 RepID=A0A8X6T8Y7_NEPPI|nr:hypothetical protein NPIL_108231 [Nephila pilipes]
MVAYIQFLVMEQGDSTIRSISGDFIRHVILRRSKKKKEDESCEVTSGDDGDLEPAAHRLRRVDATLVPDPLA